jgi:hypothetical protein
MAWLDIRVTSWSQFTSACTTFPKITSALSTSLLFRGHADASWKLEPTLLRALKGVSAEDALRVEDKAFNHFRRHAPFRSAMELGTILPGTERPALEWWAPMQHHGAPTRLLDWTSNPYVAAYFAVQAEPDKNAAIYYFDAGQLLEFNRIKYPDMVSAGGLAEMDQMNKPDSPHMLMPYDGFFISSGRMLGQQGHFTFSTNILGDHAALIEESHAARADGSRPNFGRLIIPKEKKRLFLQTLIAMNINAATMFPDLSGLGKNIAEMIEFRNPTGLASSI